MIFIGLLTHKQKQAGYFVNQDEDFVYLFHRNDGNPMPIAVFSYHHCKIRDVREAAERDLKGYEITTK